MEKSEKKKCCKCKLILPATSEFFYKNRTQKSGLDGWCKSCKKEYDKSRYKKYKYGLSNYDFNKMKKKQENRCAICGITFTNKFPYQPFVDHNHKNNNLRELLCNNCNLLLGYAFDSIYTLTNAIHYLKYNGRKNNNGN
ncbi:MAG: endonuclease domain-containing protein [Promethearchaeota archaeon]